MLLWFTLSLFLTGAEGAGRAEDEHDALVKQQRSLQARVAALKQEQDYLQFQKRMYETDSKYLVINSKKKTAQLRYKNRLLKEIRFKAAPGLKLRPGQAAMTRKVEGKKERHALVFGNAFVIKWKLSEVPLPESSLPSIIMMKKDLLSFYYTAEPGMMVYVSP